MRGKKLKPLCYNKNQYISGDGASYLRLHGILAVADEKLYVQMVFDLVEEEFTASVLQLKRSESQ